MKALVAIMGIIETPTIDNGPRLPGNNTLGSLKTTSYWLHNSEGSPQGYTSQHEYSFVEVDVDELYSIL
jgi:hypothetical protein